MLASAQETRKERQKAEGRRQDWTGIWSLAQDGCMGSTDLVLVCQRTARPSPSEPGLYREAQTTSGSDNSSLYLHCTAQDDELAQAMVKSRGPLFLTGTCPVTVRHVVCSVHPLPICRTALCARQGRRMLCSLPEMHQEGTQGRPPDRTHSERISAPK